MTDRMYHLTVGQQTSGPLTADEIRQQQLPGTSLVWKPGLTDWVALETLPELHTTPTPSLPPPVSTSPPRAYFLFGSLTNDLTAAALGGMTGSVAYFTDQMVELGFPGFALFSVGQLIFFRGLAQVGRLYQLKWVRRGAVYLILANLLGWLPLFTNGVTESAADWLSAVLSAIGTIVAFVDLWALRDEFNQKLVTAVVVGHIAEVFVLALTLTSTPVFQLLEAANVGLLAWLFYAVIDRLAPAQPTPPCRSSEQP